MVDLDIDIDKALRSAKGKIKIYIILIYYKIKTIIKINYMLSGPVIVFVLRRNFNTRYYQYLITEAEYDVGINAKQQRVRVPVLV